MKKQKESIDQLSEQFSFHILSDYSIRVMSYGANMDSRNIQSLSIQYKPGYAPLVDLQLSYGAITKNKEDKIQEVDNKQQIINNFEKPEEDKKQKENKNKPSKAGFKDIEKKGQYFLSKKALEELYIKSTLRSPYKRFTDINQIVKTEEKQAELKKFDKNKLKFGLMNDFNVKEQKGKKELFEIKVGPYDINTLDNIEDVVIAALSKEEKKLQEDNTIIFVKELLTPTIFINEKDKNKFVVYEKFQLTKNI